MRKTTVRLLAFLVVLALTVGLGSTRAADAKTKKTTYTVTTQEELVAALKKASSNTGKYKIVLESTEKATFTLSAKYSNDRVKIEINAPNATIKSRATFDGIIIKDAKSFKEYASENKTTIYDEKLTFTTMENASVEKLTIASETGTVKIVNNGGIVGGNIKGEVVVDLQQNGSCGKWFIAAPADIKVSGSSEEKLAITFKKDAEGASVESEIPLKVNTYTSVNATLEKGAEGSSINMKTEDAGVKVENNTDKAIKVKDTEGETQKVKKGGELTAGAYRDEDGTEDPAKVTEDPKKEEDPKEEDKKEDPVEDNTKKPDEDDTNKPGKDSGNGHNNKPKEDPETQLRNSLKAASGSAINIVTLSTDTTITADLTIPAGVYLQTGRKSLTISAGRLILEPDAELHVESGGRFTVGSITTGGTAPKSAVLSRQGSACSKIYILNGSTLQLGDLLFTNPLAASADPGEPFMSFDITDFLTVDKVRAVLIEDIAIKKTNGTFPTVTELNNLDYYYKLYGNSNYPSFKLGGTDVFVDEWAQLVAGEYELVSAGGTSDSPKYVFRTGTLYGLLAIQKYIEPTGTSGEPKWSDIYYTGSNLTIKDLNLSFPATLYFTNSPRIFISGNTDLTLSMIVPDSSSLFISPGSTLRTTQGADTVINGEIIINGTFVSQMGSKLVIETGKQFVFQKIETDYPVFECGVVKYMNGETPVTDILFENRGSVYGSGTVLVDIQCIGDEVSLTSDEANDIIAAIKTMIGGNTITVKLKPSTP